MKAKTTPRLWITADYEVFGNGTGCVRKCLIDPAYRMMAICEEFGRHLTFFVDVCGYWAFQETEAAGKFPPGHEPATWIADQLREAIRKGHDVQLHFHPQWLDYTYESIERWDLNYKYWRLSSVPAGDLQSTDRLTLYGLFAEGKRTLEEMLKPVKPDYICDTFRAGAWCIQPEKEVLNAMRATGILTDSSVAPGKSHDDGLTRFDFRDAPANRPDWMVFQNVCKPDSQGNIRELPITTAWVPGWRKVWFRMLRVIRRTSPYPPGCVHRPRPGDPAGKKGISRYLKYLKGEYQMLDFCNGIVYEEMKFIYRKAEHRLRWHSEKGAKLVMIGHPKTFGNEQEFRRFLTFLFNPGV